MSSISRQIDKRGSWCSGSSKKLTMAYGNGPRIEISEDADLRYCELSLEQVKQLHDLMNETIYIHGRRSFPTIDVKICDLVSVVRDKLEIGGIPVREIRLNGSVASFILTVDFNKAGDNNDNSFNDLDFIFSVNLPTEISFSRVKTAVLDSLLELLPPGVSKKKISLCSLKRAYVSKMVKVIDIDRWSLIALGATHSKTVELKFVNNMKRQYEFSVDSFHIILDTLFLFYEMGRGCSINCENLKKPPSILIGDNVYPSVMGESMYGDFHKALQHLQKKLIATRNPEEIRGGGLLKYCNLLRKGYRPEVPEDIKHMERYMCSRFFIDFSDISHQQSKLKNYLYNHFVDNVSGKAANERLKYEYLMILYQVVDESAVCLMGYERRLILSLIENMAFQLYNPTYYPILAPNHLKSNTLHKKKKKVITADIFHADYFSLYGQSWSLLESTEIAENSHSTMVDGTITSEAIPTYEIVTSSEPIMIFSNGCYHLYFSPHTPSSAITAFPIFENPSPTPQIIAKDQHIPAHQQLTMITQQTTIGYPYAYGFSCNQCHALPTTNQESTFALVPACPSEVTS